jgi:hypothetical protein
MTIPTIRDHCAAQVNDVAYLLECIRDGSSDPVTLEAIADRANTARAALAAEPAGEMPSDAEIDKLTWQHTSDLGAVRVGVAPEDVPALVHAALARWGHPVAPPAPEPGEGSDYDQEGAIAAVILDHSRVAASLGCPDPERNLGRVLRESDFGATARAILARRGRPATTTEAL